MPEHLWGAEHVAKTAEVVGVRFLCTLTDTWLTGFTTPLPEAICA